VDANLNGSVVVEHDIEQALKALKDAGVDPDKL